jgi:hypothetical protein
MDVTGLVNRLDDLIHNAHRIPLTSQVRVDPEELYAALDQLRTALGEQPRRAPDPKPAEPPPRLVPPSASDEDRTQRRVLAALIKADPSLTELRDLEQRFPGAEQAVTRLVGAGLATRLGDGIGATPAAVRYAELTSR